MEADKNAAPPVHVLVDLENNQPTLEEVRALVPDLTNVWLFHSGKQTKHLASYEPLAQQQTPVPISRPGKNSLDFHLAFYLGYIAARNQKCRLVVVALDGGYEPMIEHAVSLGLEVRRVPFGKAPAKKTAAKKTGKPSAKKTKSAANEAGRKPAKQAKPAAKAKVPAKKAADNAASKTRKKAVIASASGADDKVLDRLVTGLQKMGEKAPTRFKAYRQHLKSMLGKAATEESVDAAAAGLSARGVVKDDGRTVAYMFRKDAGLSRWRASAAASPAGSPPAVAALHASRAGAHRPT